MTRVYVTQRPYTLTFTATGTSYPLTSEDAERLISEYPLVAATRNRVTLRADDGHKCVIAPATLGGGDAFTIDRKANR